MNPWCFCTSCGSFRVPLPEKKVIGSIVGSQSSRKSDRLRMSCVSVKPFREF